MTSRLAQMQARFQQKQIQEREEKLLRLYESQQQKAFDKVGRGSAGSNTSLGSTGGGKVRQMFDERRQKAGVDKSYPLEPLKATKSNGQIRNASVDRTRSISSRTVIKSTVQKNVTQIKNGKPTVNKRELVHTVYNNNDGDETYRREKYEDDNLNETHDIIEMMNNHNLSDNLDNEEMPQIGFDEPDKTYFTGKLANVGGKLPSETIGKEAEKRSTSLKNAGTTLGKTFRKETKPIVKRTVKPAASTLNSNLPVNSQPSKSTSNIVPSPTRSVSQNMLSAKRTPQPSNSARAPTSTRPSAKQTAKSPVVRDDLNECRYCSRRFAADRLEVHEGICGKTSKKRRKIYDATKHRVEGTELETYVKKGTKIVTSKPSKSLPKKDWRRTHEEFINAIRSAKQAQAHLAKGGKLADLPPPPPSSNPDYVQCPHCGRKFNEAAAERHIPKCANFQFNKPKPNQAAKGKATARR